MLSLSTCVCPSREHVSKPGPEPVCVCGCVGVCVCVFVGGKKGGGRVFEIAAGLCQRLLAHGFPSECAGFA